MKMHLIFIYSVTQISTAGITEYLNKHDACFVYSVLICNKAYKAFYLLSVKVCKSSGTTKNEYYFLKMNISIPFSTTDVFQFLDTLLCKILNVTSDHSCCCIKNHVYNNDFD